VEEHYSRRNRQNRSAWVGGAVLVAVGVLLMLQNFGVTMFTNWWALFILIPAFGSFAAAWRVYRGNGERFTGPVVGSLIGGLVLTAVTVTFLFNMNWTIVFPVILILAGCGALASGLLKS
jgi:phosphatidylserine synthase